MVACLFFYELRYSTRLVIWLKPIIRVEERDADPDISIYDVI